MLRPVRLSTQDIRREEECRVENRELMGGAWLALPHEARSLEATCTSPQRRLIGPPSISTWLSTASTQETTRKTTQTSKPRSDRRQLRTPHGTWTIRRTMTTDPADVKRTQGLLQKAGRAAVLRPCRRNTTSTMTEGRDPRRNQQVGSQAKMNKHDKEKIYRT